MNPIKHNHAKSILLKIIVGLVMIPSFTVSGNEILTEKVSFIKENSTNSYPNVSADHEKSINLDLYHSLLEFLDEEIIEEEILLEEWMLDASHKFWTRETDLVDEEEEIQLENWMTDLSAWKMK